MNLVIGATGLVGSHVVQRLCAGGKPVRALVRRTSDKTKVQALKAAGAETVEGDLKDRASIERACRGVTAVVSTASSTISHGPGDSIQTVDREGQLNAVAAARQAGVGQFVFVSFPPSPLPSPLEDAKQTVEGALVSSGMSYTILQPAHFLEVWCSPMAGFDAANRGARIFGTGEAKNNWVSFLDVAGAAACAVGNSKMLNCSIPFGGPDVTSQLGIVRTFEEMTGSSFTLEKIPEAALRAQYDNAADDMSRSFAAVVLQTTLDRVFDNGPIRNACGFQFTSVRDFARRVVGQ